MIGETAGRGQEDGEMTKLNGICVPICTPFDESGERLDEGALRNHVDSMIEAGVHIVLVCGGTGEFAYLRADEKRRIAEIAGRHIDGRARFMVQTSAINTADAIEYAKHAEGLGADAVMVLPPYFEGPDRNGVRDHYERIARATRTPIEYIKDSTADLVRIQQLLTTGGTVFNGADPIAFAALLAGCPGCVWGAVMVYNIPQATNIDITPDFFRELLEIEGIEYIKDSTAGPALASAAGLAGVGSPGSPRSPRQRRG